MEARTLVRQLANWAEQTPNNPAVHGKDGDEWVKWSWAEYWNAARETAKGLMGLGLQPGECVAIVGNNRVDWVVCQFGIMSARAIPAPIYTTNTDEQVAYIVSHSRAKIAICDSLAQYEKYCRNLDSGDMSVDWIVTMDDLGDATGGRKNVLSLAELRADGALQPDDELDKRLSELTDSEVALLIYTSGTTGQPKAVQLDHGGILAVADSMLDRLGGALDPSDYRAVSYLPLCHIAEQLFTNFLHLNTGGEVYFCPDLKEVKDYLVVARPTLFLGVPRVWEKFQGVLEARLSEATGVKAWLSSWALSTELAAFKKELETGKEVNTFGRRIANKLVLSKIKGALGLDKLAVACTGAAPISVGTLEFFASLGIVVYEGYGMSETTGVATCPIIGKAKFGSVGLALACSEVRIAEDGEILLKGRNMTRGYMHDAEKTAELLDDEDWLHTGDLGRVDEEGFVYITGRKKDLIITAGGKNVAPAEMESYLKEIPGVGQAVVVGDRQPYLCALITLDPEGIGALCSTVGIEAGAIDVVAANEKLVGWLTQRVESDCNARVARYQTIKKFKVLPVEFTVETGELTPTMKIKRNVVNDKYSDVIDGMYV